MAKKVQVDIKTRGASKASKDSPVIGAHLVDLLIGL